MSLTLIKQIEEAEAQADALKANAMREARDIIKAVEEATSVSGRQATREIRDGAQRLIEEARISTTDEIKTLQVRRSAEREAMCELARARVEKAAQEIFERIVADGDH